MGTVVSFRDGDGLGAPAGEFSRGMALGETYGWDAFHFIHGLRNCTVRNEGPEVMSLPVGRREAYIDLAPGETVTLRAVPADAELESNLLRE